MAQPHVPPISAGRPGAPIGSREWADWFRTILVSEVQQLGKQDAGLAEYVGLLKEHRAWSLMNKPDGSFFSSIEEFCAHKRPYGLGTPWDRLRPFVVAGMAKSGAPADVIERTLQLETVAEAKATPEVAAMGRAARAAKAADAHVNCGDSLSRHDGGLDGARSAERLRAITRAPDAVKDAYREGRISQVLAAKLGPKNPDPDTAAHIASIARELPKADRKAVDAHVRERLGVKAPSSVDRALSAVERLTDAQRAVFFERVEPMRLSSIARQLTGGMS